MFRGSARSVYAAPLARTALPGPSRAPVKFPRRQRLRGGSLAAEPRARASRLPRTPARARAKRRANPPGEITQMFRGSARSVYAAPLAQTALPGPSRARANLPRGKYSGCT